MRWLPASQEAEQNQQPITAGAHTSRERVSPSSPPPELVDHSAKPSPGSLTFGKSPKPDAVRDFTDSLFSSRKRTEDRYQEALRYAPGILTSGYPPKPVATSPNKGMAKWSSSNLERRRFGEDYPFSHLMFGNEGKASNQGPPWGIDSLTPCHDSGGESDDELEGDNILSEDNFLRACTEETSLSSLEGQTEASTPHTEASDSAQEGSQKPPAHTAMALFTHYATPASLDRDFLKGRPEHTVVDVTLPMQKKLREGTFPQQGPTKLPKGNYAAALRRKWLEMTSVRRLQPRFPIQSKLEESKSTSKKASVTHFKMSQDQTFQSDGDVQPSQPRDEVMRDMSLVRSPPGAPRMTHASLPTTQTAASRDTPFPTVEPEDAMDNSGDEAKPSHDKTDMELGDAMADSGDEAESSDGEIDMESSPPPPPPMPPYELASYREVAAEMSAMHLRTPPPPPPPPPVPSFVPWLSSDLAKSLQGVSSPSTQAPPYSPRSVTAGREDPSELHPPGGGGFSSEGNAGVGNNMTQSPKRVRDEVAAEDEEHRRSDEGGPFQNAKRQKHINAEASVSGNLITLGEGSEGNGTGSGILSPEFRNWLANQDIKKLLDEFRSQGTSNASPAAPATVNPLGKVILPDTTKELLMALLFRPQSNETRQGGVNLLFHGSIGTGKTMAAQALADTLQRPLKRLNCAEMLSRPEGVWSYLQRELRVSAGSKTIVLLDASDVSRELLASPFLPLVDGNKNIDNGAVIVVTNDPEHVDETVLTRFILSVPFPRLSKEAQKQVWANKVGRDMMARLEREGVLKKDLNGKQIEHVAKTARLHASYQGQTLSWRHIADAVNSAAPPM